MDFAVLPDDQQRKCDNVECDRQATLLYQSVNINQYPIALAFCPTCAGAICTQKNAIHHPEVEDGE